MVIDLLLHFNYVTGSNNSSPIIHLYDYLLKPLIRSDMKLVVGIVIALLLPCFCSFLHLPSLMELHAIFYGLSVIAKGVEFRSGLKC